MARAGARLPPVWRQLPPLLLLLAAAAAAALLAAPAGAAEPPADVPPDVAVRWSRLDTKKWNLSKLKAALPLLQPPPGFDVSLYYSGDLLNNARSLAVSGAFAAQPGPIVVYASTRLANKTYALVDADGDGAADSAHAVLEGLDTPQGMDWHGGDLYVSGWRDGKGVILRAPGIDAYALAGTVFPADELEVVTDELPADRWHGERYMRFGPDGLLYVTIGAPCDVCKERASPSGVVYSSIYTVNVTDPAARRGKAPLALYARGLRNVVGLDWHPDHPNELYFTDNGRDNMGDDAPDCTLEWADRPGLDFGFPYCHAEGEGDPYLRTIGPGLPLPDPKYNKNEAALNCSAPGSYRKPLQALGPHVAPLGLRFYRWEVGRSWPKEFDRTLIVAERGSWDRSSKIGYRLALLRLGRDGATAKEQAGPAAGRAGGAPRVVAHEELLTGFVGGKRGAPKDKQVSWARPVDVAQLPDGSLLISDDTGHTIFRLHYTGRPRAPPPPLPASNGAGAGIGGGPLAGTSRALRAQGLLLGAGVLLQAALPGGLECAL
ncbi:sorbosone dehydrogenase [Raphidocelis subcapitata]|uniref:Sorbosone dehydrogenase n=1 Tax=Raphidocelis subcapitata TaxID=307507 RepID=A0A2V0PC40_9CHLO|nr:sorbosone dehydrogenase [Raphidocelis subcapitata]|eukprot:GBF97414.1 sorbosone dehydrogenase [Raphidocelis subcapitata]